jgi:hypothetical protein
MTRKTSQREDGLQTWHQHELRLFPLRGQSFISGGSSNEQQQTHMNCVVRSLQLLVCDELQQRDSRHFFQA